MLDVYKLKQPGIPFPREQILQSVSTEYACELLNTTPATLIEAIDSGLPIHDQYIVELTPTFLRELELERPIRKQNAEVELVRYTMQIRSGKMVFATAEPVVQEIARQLSISVECVRVTLGRAIKKLRKTEFPALMYELMLARIKSGVDCAFDYRPPVYTESTEIEICIEE